MGPACSTRRKDRKTNILIGKHEVEGELGRHRSRWEGFIETDLVEM
jgi:hypothetical protein